MAGRRAWVDAERLRGLLRQATARLQRAGPGRSLAECLRIPYVAPMAGAAVISAGVALFAWRRRPAAGAVSASLFSLAVAEWSLAYGLEVASVTLEQKLFWARVQYLGIVTAPPAALYAVLEHTGLAARLKRRHLALGAIHPVLAILLVWTSDRHRLFYRSLRLVPRRRTVLLGIEHGPLFWGHTLYSYCLVIASSVMLIRTMAATPAIYRAQRALLLVGALAPMVFNMLFLLGILPDADVDPTPFGFAVTSLALSLALFRYQLLDLVPVARDKLLESMADAVIVFDNLKRIVDLNPAAANLLQRAASRLIGQPAVVVFARFPDLLRAINGTDETQEEIRLEDDAQQRIFDMRISLLRNGRGQRTGHLLVLRDVTERRRADERRLAIERKMLETQKLESLGILASGVAHDFNNLLQVVLGNASMLRRAVTGESQLAIPLTRIETAARQAAELTRQMLAYAGEGGTTRQPVDINAVTSGLSELFETFVPDHTVLAYNLTEPLPGVMADATQLRQVVMNLVLNAAEAIGDGPGTITVRTGTETVHATADNGVYQPLDVPAGTYVVIEVADTGCGIEPAMLARIFEPFYSTKFTGRGLGLSAVLGIVRSHHGTVRVRSIPGSGSTFALLLPIAA